MAGPVTLSDVANATQILSAIVAVVLALLRRRGGGENARR